MEAVGVNIIGIKIADQFIGAEKRVRDVNANRGIQFTRQETVERRGSLAYCFPLAISRL